MGFIWTAENTAEAIRLTGEGLSASKVGLKLGTTKNSVIGKLHRIRETVGVSSEIQSGLPETKRVIFHGPVDIDGLTATHCRYPLWSGSDKSGLYCGKRVYAKSWCSDHFRIVYTPSACDRYSPSVRTPHAAVA